MVTPKNIVQHELLGLEARVASSSNPILVGLEGKVINESRNTLTIDSKSGPRVVVKEQCVFSFKLPSGERVKVEGRLIVGRPEDRTKKKTRKW